MNENQDRPYVCGAPGCSQRFQLEEHLIIHRHKHEMTLKFPSLKIDAAFTAETPTPTKFLQNCDEVGLFKEIEEEFLQAQEEEKKQMLPHNGPSCMNQSQHQRKAPVQQPPSQAPVHYPHPQSHLQSHPQSQSHCQSQTQAMLHPTVQGPLLGPSCSLAPQQALSSQAGSVITQAQSSHTGPVPGPLSCLLHMRNRHRQPLAASLPGTLPDPAMQGASAQHMTMEKQMSCIMGLAGAVHNPVGSSPQRSKQTLGPPFQPHHHRMLSMNSAVPPMGHMLEMMTQQQQAPPLQHHPHLPPPPISYHQRFQATPPQHLSHPHSHQLHQNAPPTQVHQSPPPRLPQGSPPAAPLSAPAQVSPVPSQPSQCHHTGQVGGSCSSGPAGPGAGARRRRTTEQDPDERRQKFLERNRAAATRCRQKRKLWVSSLEKKAEELTHTNLQLQNEVTSLRTEVGHLKQILLTHKDCPVTARQREAQGFTSE